MQGDCKSSLSNRISPTLQISYTQDSKSLAICKSCRSNGSMHSMAGVHRGCVIHTKSDREPVCQPKHTHSLPVSHCQQRLPEQVLHAHSAAPLCLLQGKSVSANVEIEPVATKSISVLPSSQRVLTCRDSYSLLHRCRSSCCNLYYWACWV